MWIVGGRGRRERERGGGTLTDSRRRDESADYGLLAGQTAGQRGALWGF